MIFRRIPVIINKISPFPVINGQAKVVFIIGVMLIVAALNLTAQNDSLAIGNEVFVEADTTVVPTDSITDSKDESVLTSPVFYNAKDSIINDLVNKKVLLYGEAVITYEDIKLQAAYIEYDFTSYTVHAEGVQDTAGVWTGEPVFEQGSSKFDAHAMDYNFKSKKAYVRQVETAVVEGTLTGQQVKTVEDNKVIYVKKGEYCPCEDPNAKTRFKINKLKVIKDKQIVTGPGYMAIGKIPTPLAFPFGFFPNAEKKQAGLIFPSYGNADRLGYFLNDLGFYLPVSDYVDTKILADIYSRGSWGLENITRYTKNYKYTGQFNLEYNIFKRGDQDLPNFSEERTFFVTWQHTQDRKARPNSNFSASVNAGSTQNFSNNLNASQNDFLSNTFRSNIRYDKTFYDSPWSFSLNAGHTQNSRDSIFNFTIPEFNLQKARTFPLDGLFDDNPKQRFYEKIGWTYSAFFRNTLTAKERELAFNNWEELRKKFENGINHSTNLTTSLKVGAVSINPSFNYRERWYFRTFDRVLDPESNLFVEDTVQGFDRNFDWTFSTQATTKLYGMFSFRGRKLKAIRHTMTPSVSYNYSPDFDTRVFGFYGAEGQLTSYDPFRNGVLGSASRGRQQSINFGLVNNLEAKFLSRRDTTSKFTKVALLENLSVNAAYNFAADSLKWSNISVNGFTSLGKYANVRFGANFDPYVYVPGETVTQRPSRRDVLLLERDGTLASFQNGNFAINARGLGSNMFKKKPQNDVIEAGETEGEEAIPEKPSFLSKIDIPWNLGFSYTLRANKIQETVMLNEGFGIEDSIAVIQTVQFNADATFFGKVRLSINSGYDFETRKLSTTTLLINVDLNCWELNARVVPFGFRRSYSLTLNIKSTMLRDLKLERNRPIGQNENFRF